MCGCAVHCMHVCLSIYPHGMMHVMYVQYNTTIRVIFVVYFNLSFLCTCCDSEPDANGRRHPAASFGSTTTQAFLSWLLRGLQHGRCPVRTHAAAVL